MICRVNFNRFEAAFTWKLHFSKKVIIPKSYPSECLHQQQLSRSSRISRVVWNVVLDLAEVQPVRSDQQLGPAVGKLQLLLLRWRRRWDSNWNDGSLRRRDRSDDSDRLTGDSLTDDRLTENRLAAAFW